MTYIDQLVQYDRVSLRDLSNFNDNVAMLETQFFHELNSEYGNEECNGHGSEFEIPCDESRKKSEEN